MNSINIPYHLFVPFTISLILLLLIIFRIKKIFNKPRRKSIWVSIIVFLFFYMLVVGAALHLDLKYQWELFLLDLNRDSEITKEYEIAMQRVINDTGRNFSIFTGAIFSGVLSLVSYFISYGIEKYKRLKKEETLEILSKS